ncbi:MAG: hypothetical protein SPI30_08830 [Prevotella sp.]|nr:hypothetical protein [Prevotella sp.]
MLLYRIDTGHWYGCYQRLVRLLPMSGTVRTKHWYDDETFRIVFSRMPHGSGTCGSVYPSRT